MASSVSEGTAGPEDADLRTVRLQFEEYVRGSIHARALAQKCREYYDNKQWTEKERKILEKRGQPVITVNKIKPKINSLLGLEKRMRTDPKAFPRNPQDEGSADAATDALRYVADSSDYHSSARKPSAENLSIEGICTGQVIVEKSAKEPKVRIEHIRFDRAYYDVRSLRYDFKDKAYAGYFTWMDLDAAQREWPGKLEELEQSFGRPESVDGDLDHEDKPFYAAVQGERKRVQVFTHRWIKDGTWTAATWVKGGFLDAPAKSTYTNEDGKPDCEIEQQAVYRDSDGQPYSVCSEYLDLQDEYNKRRSKMLHLLNAKRITVGKGTVSDINKLRAEMHKPDGVFISPAGVAEIKVEDNLNEAEGQWRLLQQIDQALADVGPNNAIIGNEGDNSGRAQQIAQNAGVLPLTPLFEALDSWELRLYRQAWNRIKQFWKAPMWIRVTDDEQKLKFIGLNQPQTHGDLAAQQAQSDPQFQAMQPQEQQLHVQQLAQHPLAQMPAPGAPRKNDVAQMDMDIIINRSDADTITIQQEQFSSLVSLAEKFGPQFVPFEVVVKMSQLNSDTKKMVADAMSGQQNGQAQQQQQMQQIQQKMAALEAKLKDSDANLNNAKIALTNAQTVQVQQETGQGAAHSTADLHQKQVDTASTLIHSAADLQQKRASTVGQHVQSAVAMAQAAQPPQPEEPNV